MLRLLLFCRRIIANKCNINLLICGIFELEEDNIHYFDFSGALKFTSQSDYVFTEYKKLIKA